MNWPYVRDLLKQFPLSLPVCVCVCVCGGGGGGGGGGLGGDGEEEGGEAGSPRVSITFP